MFNSTSGLVKIWVDNVKTNKYTREQVPKLSNLQEVVWTTLEAETTAA